MANFEIAYNLTAAAEGGYSNNPNDRGGETWRGIARKRHPMWIGWAIVDSIRPKSCFPKCLGAHVELDKAVREFYKKEFWDKLSLDLVANQEIANELYDTAVNQGIGQAGLFLQKALNVLNRGGRYYPDVVVDGQVGPATVSALNRHPKPKLIYKALNCLQGARYIAIAEANSSQEEFVNGWFDHRIS